MKKFINLAFVAGLVISSFGYVNFAHAAPTASLTSPNNWPPQNAAGYYYLESGAAPYLAWTSTGATSCTVNPGGFTGTSSAGQSFPAITSTTTYTLSCTDGSQTVQSSLTVYIAGASITATPSSVPGNGTVALNWSSNVPNDTCRVYHGNSKYSPIVFSGAAPGSGSVNVTTTPDIYSVICSSTVIGDNYYQDEVTINTGSVPGLSASITANGSASPPPVTLGASATIAWTSSGASSCQVTNTGNGTVWTGTSGSQSSGSLLSARTYYLDCVNGSGQHAYDNVTVSVGGFSFPSGTIDANPSVVPVGGSSVISWTSTGGTDCGVYTQNPLLLIDFSNPLWAGASGSQNSGTLSSNITYYLVCDGLTMDSAQVTVIGGLIEVSTDNINYYESRAVDPGTTIYIRWSSVGATSCSVNPGGWSGTSGTQARVVNTNKTYTLSCSNGSVSVADQAFVTMNGPDFTLTCTTLSKSVPAGQSTVFDTALAYTGGFNSAVTVSVTSGLPSGATSTPVTVTPPATSGSVAVSTTSGTPTGTSNLTFTATGGGKTHTCNSQLQVTTGGLQLDHLDLSPSASIVSIGGTQDYTATAVYTNGTSADVTFNSATSYDSSDKTIATMSGRTATGLANGTVTITAEYTENSVTVSDTASLQVGSGTGISASLFCPSGSTTKSCTVNDNSSITLSWTSNGATSCETSPALTPAVSAPSGSNASTGNLTGPQTVQYTLTCYTSAGKGGPTATDTVNVTVLGPSANFIESDKDVTKIDGASVTTYGIPAPSACSGATDSLDDFTLVDGQTLEFRICMKNTGTVNATGMTVADQLTNLGQPAAGFNARYQGVALTTPPSYNASTGELNFTIPGTLAPNATGLLTFNVIITKPSGSALGAFRIQNRATINSAQGSRSIGTPAWLVFGGDEYPSKREYAP